jgi:hypothetical protein
LVNHVCDQPAFEETLRETVRDLLPFHPVALEMARRLLDESYATSYEDFLGHFLAAQHRAINSEAFDRLVAEASGDETQDEVSLAEAPELPNTLTAGRKPRAK